MVWFTLSMPAILWEWTKLRTFSVLLWKIPCWKGNLFYCDSQIIYFHHFYKIENWLKISRLANKQDSEQALDEIDVAEKLKLETLANESQTPTRIEICSATQGTGKQVDPVIRIGFQ